MSLAITHFAFGAGMTVIVVTLLLPPVRYPRTLMVLGGVWAMVPDLNKFVPVRLADVVHDGAWANLFWAHGFLDATDPADTTHAAVVALAFFFVASLVAEGAGYHLRFAEVRDPRTDSRGTPSGGSGEVDGSRWTRPPGSFRAAHGLRQAGGLCSLVVGAGLVSYVPRTPEYTGLLGGLGLLLGLNGLVVLLESATGDGLTSRVPGWLSTGTKFAATLGSSVVVVALLVTLSDVTPISVAYAGISLLVILQLLRLWDLPTTE